MRRIYKLFVLCILLICQQHIVAQSYDLGKQKQSFVYDILYASPTENAPHQYYIHHIIQIEEMPQQYNAIIDVLNIFDWEKSILCTSYQNAYNYLSENEKWDEIKKVNKVLIDIFDNKLIKTNVEKQLKTNIEKGIPEYQTFLQF